VEKEDDKGHKKFQKARRRFEAIRATRKNKKRLKTGRGNPTISLRESEAIFVGGKRGGRG